MSEFVSQMVQGQAVPDYRVAHITGELGAKRGWKGEWGGESQLRTVVYAAQLQGECCRARARRATFRLCSP